MNDSSIPRPNVQPSGHDGAPWAGVRVVDLSGLSGAYGTRVWAALGAEVIAVEPPQGSPLRSMPPFAPGVDAPENGLWWAYHGAGKQSVVLDPATDGDTLAALLATADVVIDDAPASEIDRPVWGRRAVRTRNSDVTWISITPFGSTGPRKDWRGSDLIGWASCGLASTIGFADRAPLAAAAEVQLLLHYTSMHAAAAGMLAMRGRRRGLGGQEVDVSIQEIGLSLSPETGVPLYLDDQVARPRAGNRRPVTSPMGLFPCADGFVAIIIVQPAHWTAMAEWMHEVSGNEGVLDDIFIDMVMRREASEAIDLWVEDLTTRSTKRDLFMEGQRRGIPITPVNTVADLRNDAHLAAIGWWRAEEHPELGSYMVPGSPFVTPDDWWAWRRAPLLGEHTDDVLGALDG